MPKILNPELGRSTSLGVASVLQLNTDLTREWVDASTVGSASGISSLTGDVTATGPGASAATIANDVVTYAKIQNISAASRLLGRGSASGSGDTQEIALGTGLSMSGTTLTATGGGGAVAYPDFVAPIDANYAWINQGGASIVSTSVQGASGLFLRGPVSSGVNLRIRKKSAPATPYTVTAAVLAYAMAVNFQDVGICFRESSSGKVHAFGAVTGTNLWQLGSLKYTNPTTFSASYVAPGGNFCAQTLWLRIADNGTNRICSYSLDGQNFITLHTVGRTDFLTADEIGFFVNDQTNTYEVGCVLLSWVEA